MKQLHGVNLGGWLMTEKWMTPTVYDGLNANDEWSLAQTSEGKKRLKQHYKSFITEADFKWLRAHHVDVVRIPIGYGVFGDEAPFLKTIDYVDWAFRMAEKYNIGILIDLHGVKGSQNGYDHSGKVGKRQWYRRREYREQTLSVLLRLAERYRDNPVFWGIELMNEPRVYWEILQLIWFHRRAYRALAKVLRPGVYTIFSDAYMPRFLSGNLREITGHPIAMDSHYYQTFFPWDKRRSLESHLKKATQTRMRQIRHSQRRQPVIIGEWSRVLDGRTLRQLPSEHEEQAKQRYMAAQQAGFSEALATFYWSYKTEQPGDWNYRSLVDNKQLLLENHETDVLH